jgi:hypothetical protein
MVDGTYLRAQAKRCLDLSQQCFDLTVAEQLRVLSKSFEAKAHDIERAAGRRRDNPARAALARLVTWSGAFTARVERGLRAASGWLKARPES